MGSPFPQTLRSIEADRDRGSRLIPVASFLVLSLGLAWFLAAEVPEYETSVSARVEVARAAFPVDAPADGILMTSRLALGMTVVEGEVIAELDAGTERLRLAEEKARVAGLEAQRDRIRDEIQAAEAALRAAEGQGQAGVAEARRRLAAARAEEAISRAILDRTERNEGERLATVVETTRADVDRRKALVQAAQKVVERLEWEAKSVQKDRLASLAARQREKAELDAAIRAGVESVGRLELELQRRRIRAPVSGRVGELADLKPGSVLQAGRRLAVIVPEGEIRVVAGFLPSAAPGRIRPGQAARLRLFGYPWTRYGTIDAVVTHVGTEAHDGIVRVELAILGTGGRIPLEHGLAGVVEVEADRLSPAALALKLAGGLFGGRRTELPGSREEAR